MSREEALWVAQKNSESGVFFGILIIILFTVLAIFLVSNGEYLGAILIVPLLLLAVWSIRRAHRFSKIYEQERARAAAE